MALRVGAVDVADVKVGDVDVARVQVGDVIVWERGGVEPPEPSESWGRRVRVDPGNVDEALGEWDDIFTRDETNAAYTFSLWHFDPDDQRQVPVGAIVTAQSRVRRSKNSGGSPQITLSFLTAQIAQMQPVYDPPSVIGTDSYEMNNSVPLSDIYTNMANTAQGGGPNAATVSVDAAWVSIPPESLIPPDPTGCYVFRGIGTGGSIPGPGEISHAIGSVYYISNVDLNGHLTSVFMQADNPDGPADAPMRARVGSGDWVDYVTTNRTYANTNAFRTLVVQGTTAEPNDIVELYFPNHQSGVVPPPRYLYPAEGVPPDNPGEWNQFAQVLQLNRATLHGRDIEDDLFGRENVPMRITHAGGVAEFVCPLVDHAGNGHIRINGAGWDLIGNLSGSLALQVLPPPQLVFEMASNGQCASGDPS